MPNPGYDGPNDERLVRFQRALDETGTVAGAARLLGIPRGTARNQKAALDQWNAAPQGQKDAILHSGLSIGTAKAGWRKIKNEDGTSDSVYWRAEDTPDTQSTIDAIREGLEDIPLARPVVAAESNPDLCAVYPVADLHMGLLTDAEEVGEDWNGKKSLGVFADVFDRIVSVTPDAGTAVLAQLGDLTHSDDQRNITPQSGHQLDVDSRYFMVLRRAVAAMKHAIDRLREKHARVIYRGCRGNHDLTAHYAVTLALAEHYRHVDGVEIIDSAGEFYCYEFGVVMLVLHHGDRAKPERLVHFAAAEWPEIWGRTRYRMALSGHVHHVTRKEVGGMAFESVGTIIPRDSHAYTHGYTTDRALVSITLDRKAGEMSRARVAV